MRGRIDSSLSPMRSRNRLRRGRDRVRKYGEGLGEVDVLDDDAFRNVELD